MSTKPVPLVRVARLDAGYAAGERAITGLAFEVPEARMVAVLGPNGGGKTTLFRALLGEAPFRRGEVAVEGSISYVPQTDRARLDYPVSALDVVRMGTFGSVPWYRPLGSRERRIATDALDRVGLADEADARFGTLSGGQRQRTLIARALAQRSRVLLLDEPLSGVDRLSGEQIMRILGELRDEGHAVLVSTHDIEQARAFDLILCLNREQIAFLPPDRALIPEVLQRTYAGEIVLLDSGDRALVVQHHDHG